MQAFPRLLKFSLGDGNLFRIRERLNKFCVNSVSAATGQEIHRWSVALTRLSGRKAAGQPSSDLTGRDATLQLCSLSVFFPVYNDAPSLPLLVATAFDVLTHHIADFEVILVNDGSQDSSAVVIDQLRERYGAQLRVVTHEHNQGYGAALQSGFAAARKEWVFYTDGDGQYDLHDLPRLLERVTPHIGLVNGFKTLRQDAGHRRWIGALYNQTVRLLFGIRLRDVDCDFRLIRRKALQLEALRSTGGSICLELVRQLEASGWEVAELPVRHLPRQHGRSQFFRIKPLWVTFSQLLSLYTRLVLQPRLRRLL